LTGLLVTYSGDNQVGAWLVMLAVANALFVFVLLARILFLFGVFARCCKKGGWQPFSVQDGSTVLRGRHEREIPLLRDVQLRDSVSDL
jgi:uncharacterized membrane protein